ncbi:DNA-binding protein [Vitiosangium sp. GDMCC 1.1324]|uniref:DNA-binding protein n=1 Tax=Vitiosangium sp. (strain GDMCC 1.1324) TaxID=2138576 RepID=UPI000D33C90A|nr:DNA-binding protein [Vitiosangium sp. GDMCC 1.1324]PTL79057.1 DNA-binding protein [Vitiosangium sp. GDMCC 1.1324]
MTLSCSAVSSRVPMGPRFLLLTLSVLAACGDSGSEQPKSTPITDARKRDNGTEVTVEGYVTVQPGAFASALGNEGFALQDSTGGIYVKLAQKLDFGLGTHVRVKGTLNEEANLRILESEPASVEKLEGTQQVGPKDVRTVGIDESTEGLLVRVSGNVSRPVHAELPYGYEVYIDDGSGEVQVYVHGSAGFAPDTVNSLTVGQHIQVTGFSAQYENTYEVAPRQPSDLVVK